MYSQSPIVYMIYNVHQTLYLHDIKSYSGYFDEPYKVKTIVYTLVMHNVNS